MQATVTLVTAYSAVVMGQPVISQQTRVNDIASLCIACRTPTRPSHLPTITIRAVVEASPNRPITSPSHSIARGRESEMHGSLVSQIYNLRPGQGSIDSKQTSLDMHVNNNGYTTNRSFRPGRGSSSGARRSAAVMAGTRDAPARSSQRSPG